MKTRASGALPASILLLTSDMTLGSLYLELPFLHLQNKHNDTSLVFVRVLEKNLISNFRNC